MGMIAIVQAVKEKDLPRGWFGRRRLIKALNRSIEDGDAEACGFPTREFDMDKAWHGVHYLLTGEPDLTESALGFMACGGTEFGPDLGYGPARFFSAETVSSIVRAFGELDREEVMARYVPERMATLDIYPSVWESDDDETFAWLTESLDELRSYMQVAAERGHGVVVLII